MIGRVRCPKCLADVPESDPECPHCGIIFTKDLERETALPPHAPPGPTADAEENRGRLVTLLLGVESPTPTHAIALVVQTIGTWIMVGALVWAAIVVVNQVSALRSGRAEL